jgi:hypothetical protein
VTTQTFERFEYKFLAPRAEVDVAMSAIGDVVCEDEVAKQSGASQVNTSLYLDSPHFTFLEQHLSGSPDRIKLRVRFYGDQPKGDCFFEVKRRQNAVVMKQRAIVSHGLTRELLADLTQVLPAELAASQAMQTFQYLALRCRAEPKLLVRARRKALRASEPGVDVRLTIDDGVFWQPPRWPEVLTPDADSWRPVTMPGSEPDQVLVEVKFRDSRPWWLGVLTRHLATWRVSFSKYVSAALQARQDPFFLTDAA